MLERATPAGARCSTRAPCCCGTACLVEASQLYLHTTELEDELTGNVQAFIQLTSRGTEAGGKPQQWANHLARRTLEHYIGGVRPLQSRGRISQVSASELVTAAQALLDQAGT